MLEEVPLFADCSKRDLEAVAASLKDVERPQGAVIAREGDTGLGFFLIVVGGELDGIEAAARRPEEAGFESVWVTETARTAFLQAALAIRATSNVAVGTAVALAFPRSPAITAMTARDLAELSAGRFILGLGSQVKRVNEERFGVPFEHPAPKMGEYVEAVREVLGSFEGSAPRHEGRFYRITMAPFPGASGAGDVPIYLAAVNERMAEQAGRVADGI